jgi:hypothetical protein
MTQIFRQCLEGLSRKSRDLVALRKRYPNKNSLFFNHATLKKISGEKGKTHFFPKSELTKRLLKYLVRTVFGRSPRKSDQFQL